MTIRPQCFSCKNSTGFASSALFGSISSHLYHSARFSQTKHEFIETVPNVIVDIFDTRQFNSFGSILNDACIAFQQQNPVADDLIRKLKVVGML